MGLAHEKLAPHPTAADKEAQSRFIRNLAQNSLAPKGYELHFRRHVTRTLPMSEGRWQRRVAVVESQGRVLCGMGELTPTENGLTVHQAYGVPVLPGSSLKGITRAWLRDTAPDALWKEGGESWTAAFGRPPHEDDRDDIGEAGLVHFFDALWIPGEPNLPATPWAAEILTPHFGKYYQADSRNGLPDGTQSPIPITFLAAQGGFRVVVEGPPGLLDQALQHLLDALQHRGVGAKGRSGFGRFTSWGKRLTRADEHEFRAREEAEQARKRQQDFDNASDVASMLQAIAHHESSHIDLRTLVAHWLTGHDETDARLSRFEVTPESAAAAYRWARDSDAAKGLLKRVRDAASAETIAALERAIGVEPATTSRGSAGTFGVKHVDAFDDPTGLSAKKAKSWPNTFAERFVRGGYDEDTVRRAISHLRKHGGKDGHVRKILDKYGLESE